RRSSDLDRMRSEVSIVAGLARRVFGPDDPVPWEDFARDYDLIRDRIERVIPGFANYNERARRPGGFLLPHAPRDSRRFPTATGKANFTVNQPDDSADCAGRTSAA